MKAWGSGLASGLLLATLPTATVAQPSATERANRPAPPQRYFGEGDAQDNGLKIWAYGDNAAPVVSLSTGNGAALASAAWTGRNTGGNNIAIGQLSFAFADGGGVKGSNGAWGGYDECRAYAASSGYCEGREINITNLRSSTVEAMPYNWANPGSVGALHLASGGGCTAIAGCFNPVTRRRDLAARAADHALLVSTNEAGFRQGILFGCGSIGSTDCAGNGTGDAVRLYAGLTLRWFAPGNHSLLAITTAPAAQRPGVLEWGDDGLVLGEDRKTGMRFDPPRKGQAARIVASGGVTVSGALALESEAPTLEECGKGSALLAESTANGGAFKLGTGAKACQLRFARAFAMSAYCTVSPLHAFVTGRWYLDMPSREGFKFHRENSAGEQWFAYTCLGR